MALQPLIPDPNQPNPLIASFKDAQGGGLPPIDSTPMPSSAPSLPPSLKPLVTNPRMQQEQLLQDKINSYENPSQPQGFWHKLGHIAARVGNIAGDIVDPQAMALIKGTDLNRGITHAGQVRELAGLQNQDRQDATESSENTLRSAQTANTDANAAKTQQEINAPPSEPSLAQAYAHAVLMAQKSGKDPSQDPIVQHIADAITSLQKQPAQKPGTKTVQLQVNGKPHQVLIDEATGKTIQDLGESGEKPQTINVDARDRADRHDQQALRGQAVKTYQPALDSAERFNVMTDNAEKALRDHDQQAMLSLLTNHLGMTAGLQKGMRINQAMITEAAKSQPWMAGVKAQFDHDGYLSGVNLSPGQIHQMVGLGQSRMSEDTTKARNEAKYLGVQDDGPERTPSKTTVNYYTHLANGDPAKAKQLAAQDGWSVK